MKKTLKQLVEQNQKIVQGRFHPEPPKKPMKPQVIVTAEEKIDELDTSTLKNYSSKAAKSNLTNLLKSGEEARKIAAKRFAGMQKASQKIIAKEEKEQDEREYDYEGDMAMSDLRSIIYNAQQLHDMMEKDTNLPEWLQAKITKAEDYISSATNYMRSEVNEEVSLEEGRPSQRHPLEGHDYHKKTNAELIGIAKDAHKAAEAMKSHNTDAENKYRDQANDSATVRYFRQKNGMPEWYKKKYGHMKEDVVAEGAEDIHSHRVGDEIVLKNKDYHGVIVKSKGSDISFKNKSDDKHYKATHGMIDRNLSQENRYKERSAVQNKKFDDAISKDMERIHKSGALKKFGIGVKEEVEQIDEISKTTLGSYVKRASQDAVTKAMKYASNRDESGKESGILKKISDRESGIRKATDRLTKEERDLEEAVYSIKNTKTGQIYFHSKYPINKDNERLKKIQSAGGDHIHATPHKDSKPMNEAWNQPDYIQSIKAHQAKNNPTVKEELENLEEKNVPTSPEKWAQAKSQAKAKFDVYPSAYANGWAAKKYKEMGGGWKSVSEEAEVNEDLRKWFDPDHPQGDWKRINSKGEAIGPCAREPGEPKPKCMSKEKRDSLTKKERASAVASKRKHDPDPERKGEPINVSNYGKGKISEQVADAPFDPPYSKSTGTHTDKSGAKHGPMSTAKHLARMALAKQARTPAKKTDDRKTSIVREAMADAKKRDSKKKDEKKMDGSNNDKFQADPELTTQKLNNF
jgi:hypothetical protein